MVSQKTNIFFTIVLMIAAFNLQAKNKALTHDVVEQEIAQDIPFVGSKHDSKKQKKHVKKSHKVKKTKIKSQKAIDKELAAKGKYYTEIADYEMGKSRDRGGFWGMFHAVDADLKKNQ